MNTQITTDITHTLHAFNAMITKNPRARVNIHDVLTLAAHQVNPDLPQQDEDFTTIVAGAKDALMYYARRHGSTKRKIHRQYNHLITQAKGDILQANRWLWRWVANTADQLVETRSS